MAKKQPRYGENNASLVNGYDGTYVSQHITDSDGDSTINMTSQSGDYLPPSRCTDGFLLAIVAPGPIVVKLTGSDDAHTFTIPAAWMVVGQVLNYRCASVVKSGTTGTFKAVW